MATVKHPNRMVVLAIAFSASVSVAPAALAQPSAARLFESAPAGLTPAAQIAPVQARFVAVRTDVLARSAAVALNLFPGTDLVARRTAFSRQRPGSYLWHGAIEGSLPGAATFAVVDGTVAGTIWYDGRLFEVRYAGGPHELRELNPSLFPSDDLPVEADASSSGAATTVVSGDAASQIDVMIVWTPKARNAAGGTVAAIQSLVDLAVANTNTTYANSGVPTQLRLVYSGEVAFSENVSDITSDLTLLRGTNDGVIDQVHTLRTQYAADMVQMIGSGYTASGSCGVGYIMQSVSTSFSPYAFTVVDQSCAAGNLSTAHEFGHNEGLAHDLANASSAGSFAYAYGFQDPGGRFRTVMSYGGATRIAYLSSAINLYGGVPLGTSTQDNARGLTNTAGAVANFRSLTGGSGGGGGGGGGGTTCTYTVSPTSLSFTASGGSAAVSVTTASGCPWSALDSLSWVTVGPGGMGSGSVSVNVSSNPSNKTRTGSITVAGIKVAIAEPGSKGR